MGNSSPTENVRHLFNRIANRYDLGNDLISAGTHRLYKKKALRVISLSKGDKVVDLCTGTGDLLIEAAKIVGEEGKAVGVDFSEEMLEIARKRVRGSELKNVEIVHADVTNLPFEKDSFDAATMAFGLRNILERELALKEAFRVLRRGGRLSILEFSNPREFICPRIYRVYLDFFVPFVGGVVSGNRQAYEYLAKSISHFPYSEEILEEARRVGFQGKVIRFLGGSISLYNCLKP